MSATTISGRIAAGFLKVGILSLVVACQPPNIQFPKIPSLKIPSPNIQPLFPGGAREEPESAVVVESRIDGDFEGWDGDTIFELTNGQVWQQARYAYRFSYRFRPKVTIFRVGRWFEMEVEGVSSRIRVERVR